MPAGPETAIAGWPQRRHYGWLVLFFMALALYGSLIPLQFQPMSFAEAVERFRIVLQHTAWPRSQIDWTNNFLLFLPIGYCLPAALALDRPGRLARLMAIPSALVVSFAFSAGLEFSQIFIPTRFPSGSDIFAQTCGATVGMIVWLSTGRVITEWLRSYRLAQRPRDQVDWLLQAYLLGYLVYGLLPLDLTLSPRGLLQKFHEGGIVLVPFAHGGLNFETFYGLLRDVGLSLPIGMWAATWLTSPRWPARSMRHSVLLGGCVVTAVEVAHLLIRTRTVAADKVIVGTAGVALGAWIMRRLRGAGGAESQSLSAAAWSGWKWLGAAAVYAILLIYVFCGPLQPLCEFPDTNVRLHGFFRPPFANLYHLTLFDAISQVLRKGLFFAPLGAMLALSASSFSIPPAIRRILLTILVLATAALATLIEMLQVFLPPHVPTIDDVIFCTLGSAVGMLVTTRHLSAVARR